MILYLGGDLWGWGYVYKALLYETHRLPVPMPSPAVSGLYDLNLSLSARRLGTCGEGGFPGGDAA